MTPEERIDALAATISDLRAAITETLAENRHLADGENCSLIKLKRAIKHKNDCACGMPWEPDSDQFGCWSCGAEAPDKK